MRVVGGHAGHRAGGFADAVDDRGQDVRDLEGKRQPGKRIRAVLDMLCDNNKEGKETLLAAVKHGEDLISARNP